MAPIARVLRSVEHRRAQSLLRERGRSAEDEILIFTVIKEQRALVDTATAKTRGARRLSERRDRPLSGADPSTIEESGPDHAVPIHILYLAILKWTNGHAEAGEFDHLNPAYRRLAALPDEVRIVWIRADRWIGIDHASLALARLENLQVYPPRDRATGCPAC